MIDYTLEEALQEKWNFEYGRAISNVAFVLYKNRDDISYLGSDEFERLVNRIEELSLEYQYLPNVKPRKKRKTIYQFSDFIALIYPSDPESKKISKNTTYSARNITFQVTDDCNLACTYCYQINKGARKMSFETAKKCIDKLLDDEQSLTFH